MTKVTSFLCVIAAVGCVPLAQADMMLSYQLPGGSPTQCFLGSSDKGPGACPIITGSGVVITDYHALSNSPGNTSGAEELGTALTITDNATGPSIIRLWLVAQDFTIPTTAIDYASNLAITSLKGAGSVGLTSCVDRSNGLIPPTTPFCSPGSPELTNVTESFTGPDSDHNTVTSTITSLTPPYSLSEEVTLTLTKGAVLNVITSQTLTPTAVPEPVSIALLGCAMLFIVVGSRLVRRKT
jgi:hypothetical protein